MQFLRIARPNNKRLNDRTTEGDLHGKESQEGRQESYQEGQIARSHFQFWFFKGATASRGAFFRPMPGSRRFFTPFQKYT